MLNSFFHKSFIFIIIAAIGLRGAYAAIPYTVETVPNVHLIDRNNYVSDPDDLIGPADRANINTALRLLEDSVGIEVAVVALEAIEGGDARTFATELFNHWGLGKDGADNGLLIQLVATPGDRSIVFETGYGLEGILPDALCYRLQQHYMVPDLREGRYGEGLAKGVEATVSYLLSHPIEQEFMKETESGFDPTMWIFAAFFVGFLVLVGFAAYLQRRPRTCPRCGAKAFSYAGTRVLIAATRYEGGLEEKIYRCKKCGYTENHRYPTDRLHGGGGPIIMGGGGFGGFSGGGGGSWGGGNSGGGGAMSRF